MNQKINNLREYFKNNHQQIVKAFLYGSASKELPTNAKYNDIDIFLITNQNIDLNLYRTELSKLLNFYPIDLQYLNIQNLNNDLKSNYYYLKYVLLKNSTNKCLKGHAKKNTISLDKHIAFQEFCHLKIILEVNNYIYLTKNNSKIPGSIILSIYISYIVLKYQIKLNNLYKKEILDQIEQSSIPRTYKEKILTIRNHLISGKTSNLKSLIEKDFYSICSLIISKKDERPTNIENVLTDLGNNEFNWKKKIILYNSERNQLIKNIMFWNILNNEKNK